MGVRRTPRTAKTSARQIALAERRAVVLDLRREGHDFRTIASHVGVSAATAYRDVTESIAQITREPAAHLLQLELLRLDEMQRGFYAAAVNGDIAATNMCLRILDQRCRLLGLYKSGEGGQQLPRPPTVRVMLGDRPFTP